MTKQTFINFSKVAITIFKFKYLCVFFITLVIIQLLLYNKLQSSEAFPVIIWWTKHIPGKKSNVVNCGNFKCLVTSDREQKKALAETVKAYLFYGSDFEVVDLPLPRYPMSVLWGLLHEESPRNNELFLSEIFLSLFNFSSTFSRYSNIPLTLQSLQNILDITDQKYFVSSPEKDALLKEIAPVLYIQSDCETATDRDSYVEELMKYIKVDSYGECLNNKKLDKKFKDNYLNNLNSEEFLQFVARYKFTIAIENGVCNDYITEKLWRAIHVGSVPIYYGSPEVSDYLPNNNSALLIENFESPKNLAEHLNYLLTNKTAYESYLQHKINQRFDNQRLIRNLNEERQHSNFEKSIESFECFVCESIYTNNRGIVDKSHYNCPTPKSPITWRENPDNFWFIVWKQAQERASVLYKAILANDEETIESRAKI